MLLAQLYYFVGWILLKQFYLVKCTLNLMMQETKFSFTRITLLFVMKNLLLIDNNIFTQSPALITEIGCVLVVIM